MAAQDTGANDPWSSLFEFLPIGAYRTTPAGQQLRANPALVRFNGFANEAEQIAKVADIAGSWYVQPGRRDAFMALIERDGQVIGFESEVRRYNTGEPVWVRENAHAVRGADGHIRYIEGTIEDISAEVRTREALALSEASMRELVSLVPGVIYKVQVLPDGGRRFIFISEAVQSLFGVSREAVMADAEVLVRLRHPDDRAYVASEVERVARKGAALAAEFRILRPDGQLRWVSWLSSPTGLRSDGLPVRAGVIIDITARKEAELAAARSARELAQLVAMMPGMVYRLRIDARGQRRYSFVSERVHEIYGLAPAAVLADGEALARLRHPDDQQRLEHEVDVAHKGSQALAYELRILRASDGAERWIQVISQPAPPEDGHEVRVGVLFDITERKVAELALKQQSELWLQALQASGDGVWDWHVQAGVEILSPQCKALYGFGLDELPDTPDALDSRTHPDDKPAMHHAREAHFAGHSARYVSEHRVQCKNGEWKWILSRGLVIERDAAGQPLRMIGTHTDVTAAKQAEALRLERDSAAAADRAKSEFLSRVSHELRTPLNAVLGFAQLLEIDPGGAGERQRAWVAQVLSSGRHLLALLEDILDLSSLQSGRLVMLAEPVPLAAVVDEAWTMLVAGPLGDSARALPFDDQVGGSGAVLRADRKRLKQVVANLLSNAVKYNRAAADGGYVRVQALALPASGDSTAQWELRVSDGGIGLSDAQRARLFNPFDRLGAERGPVAGTGLGLALTRQLVQALGGEITVASEPGRGSVFSVRLPAA